MELTANVSERIRAVLRRYLAQTPHEDFTGLPDAASQVEALPILKDPGGCFGLRRDGTVISWVWKKQAEAREETDPRIRNMVLFGASQKYPELAALAPERPSDAGVCPHCGGTGVHPMSQKPGLEGIGCYCGGLGWIPASDLATSRD